MHKYRLGIEELYAAVGDVNAGTSILVAGPPMCGKRAILHAIAACGLQSGEGAILITMMKTGENVLSTFKSQKINTDHLRIIDSLSTLLMYSSLQTVFHFVHMLNGRIQASGSLGVGVVEEGMHDDRTMAALMQLYSAAVEIKEAENASFIRAIGLTPRPTQWYEIGQTEETHDQ